MHLRVWSYFTPRFAFGELYCTAVECQFNWENKSYNFGGTKPVKICCTPMLFRCLCDLKFLYLCNSRCNIKIKLLQRKKIKYHLQKIWKKNEKKQRKKPNEKLNKLAERKNEKSFLKDFLRMISVILA